MYNSFSEPPVRGATRSPSPAPPAPPLPQSRYLDVAKNLIAPFRYGAKPPREPSASRKADSFYYSNLHGPSLSQSTTIRLGVRINALDISEDRTRAILAGHRILKIVRVDNAADGSGCFEELDLRSTAIDHAHAGKSSVSLTREERGLVESRQRETQGIEDVAWSSKVYSSHIATAGSNGKVLLWDLNRPELELARLHEHQRQVHKVTFNRTDVALLLSGSQDATVRLWDLRQLRKDVMVCHSRSKILTQADGVRDVKWSPTDPMIFALGTEGGVVQRWDIRQTGKPQLKLAAHDKPCTVIAWHFDGRHIVSGGKDRRAKIWDFGSNNKRQRAKYHIRTPREIRTISWRPPCNISDSPNLEVWQCAQLATSYEDHPAVHIWDWRREHMPHREIYFGSSENGPADMLWHSKDLLWAVGHGKELGDFAQIDVQFIPKQLEKRNLQTLASSPQDELVMFAQQRLNLVEYPSPDSRQVERPEFERHPSPKPNRRSPMSRSPGDDSLDDNFLSAAIRHIAPLASSTVLLNRPQGNNVVSESAVKAETPKAYNLKLDQILRQFDNPPPSQWSKTGLLPGSPSAQIFNYLAQKYKPISMQSIALTLDGATITNTFEQNASYAQTASLYRDAQTWRIFGSMILNDLMKRANFNKARRCMENQLKLEGATSNPPSEEERAVAEKFLSSEAPEFPFKQASAAKHSAVRAQESTSNVPTPLAKPLDMATRHITERKWPPELRIEDDLQLPASSVPSKTRSPTRNRIKADPQKGNVIGSPSAASNWYESTADREERLAKVSQWRAVPKTPLNPNTFIEHPIYEDTARLERKDSVDSFVMFSGSLGSQPALSKSNSFASRLSQSSDPISLRQASNKHGTHSDHDGDDSEHLSLSPEKHIGDSTATSSIVLDDALYGSKTASAQGISHNGAFSSSTTNSVVEKMKPLGAAISFESTAYNSSQSSQLGSFSKATASKESSFISPAQKSSVFTNGERASRENASNVHKPKDTNSSLELLDPSQFSSIPFIPEDFYFPDPKISQEQLKSLTSTAALRHLLKWYASHHNSQMASHLLLCWRTLLPTRDSIPTNDERFFDYIISGSGNLNTFINETIHSNFRAADIPPLWVESILSTYHEQLMTLNLLNPATALRRLAHPAFPAVYEQSTKDVEIGTLCQSCKKPINNAYSKLRCDNCSQRQSPCSICWLERSPFTLPTSKKGDQSRLSMFTSHTFPSSSTTSTPASIATTLWTSCLLCGHSGHAACLSTWFSDLHNDGACPTPGCLCDCVRGRRRDLRLALLASKEKAKKTAAASRGKALLNSKVADISPVRRDYWDVGESFAVGRARSALASSAGTNRTELKAGKRVRLVVPDDEGQDDGAAA